MYTYIYIYFFLQPDKLCVQVMKHGGKKIAVLMQLKCTEDSITAQTTKARD